MEVEDSAELDGGGWRCVDVRSRARRRARRSSEWTRDGGGKSSGEVEATLS